MCSLSETCSYKNQECVHTVQITTIRVYFFCTEVHLSLSNHVTGKFTGMCGTIEAVALPPSDSSTHARTHTHTPPVLCHVHAGSISSISSNHVWI